METLAPLRRGFYLLPRALCGACYGGPNNENDTDVDDGNVTACCRLFQGYQLDSIARELETTVNRCVIDVRDKTWKYETSPAELTLPEYVPLI